MNVKKINTILINFRHAYYSVLVSLLVINTFPALVSAQGTNPPGSMNPLTVDSFYEFIKMILQNIVVPIGGLIAVMAIIYSGFLFVTAQGNTEQLSRARSAFLWAVIGGLILLGAWLLATMIESTIDQITP